MNIEQIREFVVLADKGNFQEAAFYLFTTQSTLSKHLQGMEAELGGRKLFLRGRSAVKLSQFGQRFYPYAIKIVQLYGDFLTETSGKIQNQNTICVGYPPNMDAYGFFDTIKAFCDQNPDCMLFLDDEQVSQKLDSDELDIGILYEDIRNAERNNFFLTRDRLVPVLPSVHPLAQRRKISLYELREEKFIGLASGLFLADKCMDYCRQSGFEPHIVHTVDSMDGCELINLVAQNFGVTLLPEQEARYWNNPNISIVEPDSSFIVTVSVQWKKSHTLSASEKRFMEFLKPEVTD